MKGWGIRGQQSIQSSEKQKLEKEEELEIVRNPCRLLTKARNGGHPRIKRFTCEVAGHDAGGPIARTKLTWDSCLGLKDLGKDLLHSGGSALSVYGGSADRYGP